MTNTNGIPTQTDPHLGALASEISPGTLPPTAVLADCASYMQSRYELNRGYLGEIAQRTQLPVVPLPYLTQGIAGPDDLATLAPFLLADPDADGEVAPGIEASRGVAS